MSVAVHQYTRAGRAQQATGQRAAVGPADHFLARQFEIRFAERFRAADHDPVVAEQQAAERGHKRNHPDVAVQVATLRGMGGRR